MNQISPNKAFIITWAGADPNDTTTLYVQAVIKDAVTLKTLATVNLTDRGSHLFSGSYTTPMDPNQLGTGRQIIITTTVYTDAGYTTPSQNYERISQDYLVKQQIDASQFWGAGGSAYDPKDIKKAVKEALDELEPVEAPEPPAFPLDKITEIVRNELKGLPREIPEAPEPDLNPLLSELHDVRRAITMLPTFAKPTDLKPLQNKIDELDASVASLIGSIGKNLTNELQKVQDTALKENEKMVNTMIQTILTAIADHIKDGSFHLTMFGSENPFDQTPKKKSQYLESLKAQYKK